MRFVLFAMVILFGCSLSAQTEVSGIVNSYAVLTSYDDCSNSLSISNSTGFEEGMSIIIIQMSGATINESNSSSYGSITDLGGTGRYEYNRILATNGNTLTLEQAILHDYDTDGLTQVLCVPIYPSVIVSDSIFPPPWNGQTGGVLLLEAEESITIQGKITASRRGYRGGTTIQHDDINCTVLTFNDNWHYEIGNWRGAPKGEGIAPIIPGKEAGRGPQANGGGGGNNHNAGGGGGSHIQTGGQGGENDEPSFGGCDGFYPGRGGRALPDDNNLLFMGGGGGAGHRNNNHDTGGGNGGGIIIIKSPEIIFAGGTIESDGENGHSPNGDGAGGGGAGGAIVLVGDMSGGAPVIQAIGGGGGNVDNNAQNRCFGPGGGGSGGRFLTNLGLVANLAGGNAGLSLNSTDCGPGSNGAEAGNNHSTDADFSELPQGENALPPAIVSINNDTIVCQGQSFVLSSTTQGSASLQWQVNNEGDWTNLSETALISGTQTNQLFIGNLGLGQAQFRLVMTPENNCFSGVNSDPITVSVNPAPSAAPTFTLDGLQAAFTANASDTDNYAWSIEGQSFSSQANPSFTFPVAGIYQVELTVDNDCGEATYSFTVELGSAPVAAFTADRLGGCAPLFVQFSDTSEGEFDSREWTFEGGTPANSTEATPSVVFETPGVYEVSLTLTNAFGTNSSTQMVEVAIPPQPAFGVMTDGLQVTMTNNSGNATIYTWNFGDDNTSNEVAPIYTYATPGIYEITLNAQNEYCGAAISQTIEVMVTSTEELLAYGWKVYPNPVEDELWLEGDIDALFFYSADGQLIRRFELRDTRHSVSLLGLPAGTYLLRLEGAQANVWVRLVKL